MIEPFNPRERSYLSEKLNEMIDSINALEDALFGGEGDDDDVTCPDCHYSALLNDLDDLTTEQLKELISLVESELERRTIEPSHGSACNFNCIPYACD